MTTPVSSVLIVEPDPKLLRSLESTLDKVYDTTPAMSAAQAMAHLHDSTFESIVVNIDDLGEEGLALLKQCQTRYPHMVRVFLYDGNNSNSVGSSKHDINAFQIDAHAPYDLIANLKVAIEQRKHILLLEQHIELRSELLDINRRLHPELSALELAEKTAVEMSRLTEVLASTVSFYSEKGELTAPKVIKGSGDFDPPGVAHPNDVPVTQDDHYVYTKRIGEPSNPKASIALKLSHVDDDVVRYLEFVARHSDYTYSLLRAANLQKRRSIGFLAEDPLRGDGNEVPGTVSASQMSDALTTPSTVAASAADALRRIIKGISQSRETGPEISTQLEELQEVATDLRTVGEVMSRLLDRLKLIQNDQADSDYPSAVP